MYILIMYINYYSLSLSSVGYTSVRAHTQCQLYSCTQNAVSAVSAFSQVCQVGWSGPHQGFLAHVERYRNSPVMHKSTLAS